MVKTLEACSRAIGTVLMIGSRVGVGLSFLAIVALSFLGKVPSPWPLGWAPWWGHAGADPIVRGLQFLAGLGMLGLFFTPLAMLLLLLFWSLRAHEKGLAWTTAMLLGLLALGIWGYS